MPQSDPNADPVADTLDASGLTCGRLEPMLAQRLRALAPGELLEILSDRSEARDGIAAWAWLTGHSLVAVKDDEPPRARYYVRKKNQKGA
jgi:TusA-related sulfurtransferase